MTVSTQTRLCLQDALTPRLEPSAWADLDTATAADVSRLAVAHGVEGWVRRRAEAAGMRLPLLTGAVHAALARHQRAVTDLRTVAETLNRADLEFLVVKGPALVAQFYPAPELRSSVDLDILVRPAELPEALTALEQAGCTLLDANWPLLTRLQVLELRLQAPSGGLIDLHWSLGIGPSRKDRSPGVDTLIARSRVIDVEGQRARTLGWADTVVHLAVHAAASGGDRLIWYADLRAALAAAPPGGDEAIIARASEWGARPPLHLMLTRGRRAIGLQPSQALLDGLTEAGPGIAWSALVRSADRIAPIAGATPGEPSLRRIVARSARHDAWASWRALSTKSLSALRPGRSPNPDELRDPADPRSGLFPAGGPSDRADFLRRVSGADDSSEPARAD